MLLTMQAKGYGVSSLSNDAFEYADDAFAAVPQLPSRHHDPKLEELVRHADRIEHLQAGRMERAGTQVHEQLVKASSTVTGISRCARASAQTSPTGPPPDNNDPTS